jgi:DNA mismatch endonuclease, patch repair protein
MSKISGNETKPEIIVRRFLFAQGYRYRKNDKRYPGKPDIILPKYKTAVLVHGCFWHGHHCKFGKLPKTRKEFWAKKISDNIKRDKKNQSELEAMGWKVLIVWQCNLKNGELMSKRLNKLTKEISNRFF